MKSLSDLLRAERGLESQELLTERGVKALDTHFHELEKLERDLSSLSEKVSAAVEFCETSEAAKDFKDSAVPSAKAVPPVDSCKEPSDNPWEDMFAESTSGKVSRSPDGQEAWNKPKRRDNYRDDSRNEEEDWKQDWWKGDQRGPRPPVSWNKGQQQQQFQQQFQDQHQVQILALRKQVTQLQQRHELEQLSRQQRAVTHPEEIPAQWAPNGDACQSDRHLERRPAPCLLPEQQRQQQLLLHHQRQRGEAPRIQHTFNPVGKVGSDLVTQEDVLEIPARRNQQTVRDFPVQPQPTRPHTLQPQRMPDLEALVTIQRQLHQLGKHAQMLNCVLDEQQQDRKEQQQQQQRSSRDEWFPENGAQRTSPRGAGSAWTNGSWDAWSTAEWGAGDWGNADDWFQSSARRWQRDGPASGWNSNWNSDWDTGDKEWENGNASNAWGAQRFQ